MNKTNIVFNFTGAKGVNDKIDNQPLAVIPAPLAKRLLKAYADSLGVAPARLIIRNFSNDILSTNTVEEAVDTALSFIQERELIANVTAGNWDAYKVEPEPIAEEPAV